MSKWYEKNGSLRNIDTGNQLILDSDLLDQIASEHNMLENAVRIIRSARNYSQDRLAAKKLFQLFPLLDELAKAEKS